MVKTRTSISYTPTHKNAVDRQTWNKMFALIYYQINIHFNNNEMLCLKQKVKNE